ncbi:MAG: DUF1013 domain-containing protein [Alphaproteobacteria bacterium]|nr:DUF1013 domain-containing protein [Alphaproteobacteria bacterium]
MNAPLMPKATAVWLIDNTTLTFEQIGDFCHLHPLEVQAIADGDISVGILGHDPITSGQLTFDEIERCQADPSLRLQMSPIVHQGKIRKKAKYTPVALRQAKPNGIAWLLKEIPNITDGDIIRTLGTTKMTIQSIRTKTHRTMSEIKPANPVHLGLCSFEDLNELLEKYK